MEYKKTIFLTGATGFLGSYLLKILISNNYRVICLARSKNDKSAKRRVIESILFWDSGILDKVNRNLEIIEGDVARPQLGISDNDINRVAREVSIIFNSAALAKLRVPLEEIRKINVEGAKNVFDFALRCQEEGKLEKINHISTAYVVGTKKDIEFTEDMLEVGQRFNNTYEQSKFEAELALREYAKKGLRVSTFRPSMIMGDSKEGKTNNFRVFYEPFHFFAKEIFQKFAGNLDCFQNLINIDTVAYAIFLLGVNDNEGVYNITSFEHINVGFFIEIAADFFNFKIPEFTPEEKFDLNSWTPVQREIAGPFVPYFNYTTKFPSQKTQAALEKFNFKYPSINKDNLLRVFSYCDKKGFIKRRTKK